MSVHCSNPTTCSICSGAPARRVELRGGVAYVDGVPQAPRRANRYSVRGGEATAQRSPWKRP